MIVESEIRNKLVDFLRDKISLQDFEDWLVSHSWNMHLDSSADAQDLVSAIELAFSEYSNGHRSYQGLREEVESLLDNIVISINIGSR